VPGAWERPGNGEQFTIGWTNCGLRLIPSAE